MNFLVQNVIWRLVCGQPAAPSLISTFEMHHTFLTTIVSPLFSPKSTSYASSLYRQFFYSREILQACWWRQMDCECLSFHVFFGYHRVRGMICWSADEVYRSTSFILGVLWFFAPPAVENTCRWTCRWERSPIRRADKEAEWSCQKPFIIRRTPYNGAVTARPYLYSAVTAPSIIERCFAVGCRSLPYFSAHRPTYTLGQKNFRLVQVFFSCVSDVLKLQALQAKHNLPQNN